MLSRVAENLYWLGRHLERAENVARMARADHEASLESRRLTTTASAWDGLLSATGAEEAYATAHEADPTLSVADFLILGENENSLRATVARARRLARGLREHITPEAWEEINFAPPRPRRAEAFRRHRAGRGLRQHPPSHPDCLRPLRQHRAAR